MDCIFCKIVEGIIPAKKIYEDKKNVAFLDINPMVDGHTIVAPKQHVEEFYQLNAEDYGSLMGVIKKIAGVIKKMYNPFRVGMVVYGFDVPHAHVHLYPNTGKEVTMHHVLDYSESKLDQELKKLKNFIINDK